VVGVHHCTPAGNKVDMNKSGKYGEDLAAEFLMHKGYRILERNWRGVKGFRCPEIDIIAEKHNMIVFVEVKTSSTGKFGPPEHWITPQKRQRLVNGANAYLSQNFHGNIDSRFDVITIDRRPRPSAINHIENAFLVSDDEFE
jgi:putative endonuclease